MTGQESCCEAPEVVALCREDEAGKKQVVGWAMVLGERMVAYVPGTGADTPLLNAFSSPDSAERILGYADIYPVCDWSASPGIPHAR